MWLGDTARQHGVGGLFGKHTAMAQHRARVTLSLSLSLLVYLFSSLVWAGIFSFFKLFKFLKPFYSFFFRFCGKIHKFTTLFLKILKFLLQKFTKFTDFLVKFKNFIFLWIASACATSRNDEWGKFATPYICKTRNDDYFYSKRFQFFEKSHFKG